MTAVDTNVLVRIITNDDRAQAARAVAFLSAEDSVLVAKTVMLELEWVLRAAYGLARTEISAALDRLLSLHNVEVEDEPAVARALEWYRDGLDHADALHVASAGLGRRFATFDLRLRRRIRRSRVAELAGL